MTTPGANLELRGSPYRSAEEGLVRNNWVADIYGRNLGFGDMGVLDMAHLESQVEPFGALIILEEHPGASLEFGRGLTSNHIATEEQLDVVDALAALDSSENYIPAPLGDRAKHELPALYLAHIGIVKGGILFNGRARERFLGLLLRIGEADRKFTAEDEALYARAQSLQEVSLPAPAFILETAKHAQRAK